MITPIWLVVEETDNIKHEIVYGLHSEIGRFKTRDATLVFYKVSKASVVFSYDISNIPETKVVTVVTNRTFISKERSAGDIPPDIMLICSIMDSKLKEVEGDC